MGSPPLPLCSVSWTASHYRPRPDLDFFLIPFCSSLCALRLSASGAVVRPDLSLEGICLNVQEYCLTCELGLQRRAGETMIRTDRGEYNLESNFVGDSSQHKQVIWT